ncbi:MAG: 16S rRNA (cytosine(1402)-N(4))-methyltransferase RsmH [bacterium]|nr:16S rRNA (cytosine(1402)-N(4))-methyltransferase RsmH [bacterium]
MHISVLKEEAITGLNIKEDGIYVDMTLGYAGHASEILKRNKKGFLFAFDKDINACSYSADVLKKIGSNFKIFNTGNINMKEVLKQEGIEKVDGFLFDLGLSSVEIDNGSRGFSYMIDAPLDMRMDTSSTFSAKDLVNTYSEKDLYLIFRDYGEEKYAKKIAAKIVEQRSVKEIETTLELVDIIDSCIPYKDKRHGHPAKRVFQAIRIEVNNELGEFKKALTDALEVLNVDGYISCITFHSLEDRICKNIFKSVSEVDPVIKGLPNVDPSLLPDYEIVTKKPILPSDMEINENPRSKSAKLRIIKRIK